MNKDARIARMPALWVAVVAVVLLLPASNVEGSSNGTQADQDDLLQKKLLLAGSVVGFAVVLILVITQMRGTRQKQEGSNNGSAGSRAKSVKSLGFRCRSCGRTFRAEVTAESTIECPRCGHVGKWPPPAELKLVKDRMTAFALDPRNPRGDITLAVKTISLFSKGVAERILSAGKYLEPGEMLAVCEGCREIHITQARNRGLLGVCARCSSLFVIS
jgi:DNA-directed RNA polymerase subunit RPC12/RpoP